MKTARYDVPSIRIRTLNDAEVAASGDFVLYWMTAFRRTRSNFSLQRAIEWAEELDRPLLVFEALRCDYPWASDRLHQFIVQGMADNARELAQHGVRYYAYLEPKPGAGRGLLQHLADHACVVISDDFPCFFLPRMMQGVAPHLPVRFELVDSNGLLPMRAADRVFPLAHAFRRFLQKTLRPHLDEFPQTNPFRSYDQPSLKKLPANTERRWPAADVETLASSQDSLAAFPIDHGVEPSPIIGGSRAAAKQLKTFVEKRLSDYSELRNHPDADAASGLSPYLHFGHIGVHEVFEKVMRHDGWSRDQISPKAHGGRQGWWGASEPVEAFLDELITWREVGYNMCWQREDYDQFESLPDWAQTTLAKHTRDRREYIYDEQQLCEARTHDPLWNAAQRQLVREGRIHNYLRMLWGKKILQWSETPREALRVMIELNNRFALDGRNPNSYSGIFWVLGRYDRAWGPERPIFGKVRYMSSENTARKVRLTQYLQRYQEASP